MFIKTYKTHKITANENLFSIIDQYLPTLQEKSVVVITSKIISLCQGNVVKNNGTVDKKDLIKQEADYYLEDDTLSRFGVVIPTIKENILIANAGIDESNAGDYFVLWPKNLQEATTSIWKHLKEKHTIENIGVLVTDSRLAPLRWGITGVGLSWCGFEAVKNYVGTKDIFGKTLRMSQESILDGLAAAVVVVMGEGDEQTPLAVIEDLPFVTFQDRPPTEKEKQTMHISLEDDIYGKFLNSVTWKKGSSKS